MNDLLQIPTCSHQTQQSSNSTAAAVPAHADANLATLSAVAAYGWWVQVTKRRQSDNSYQKPIISLTMASKRAQYLWPRLFSTCKRRRSHIAKGTNTALHYSHCDVEWSRLLGRAIKYTWCNRGVLEGGGRFNVFGLLLDSLE